MDQEHPRRGPILWSRRINKKKFFFWLDDFRLHPAQGGLCSPTFKQAVITERLKSTSICHLQDGDIIFHKEGIQL
jgi:hypothetical protein